MNLRTIILAFLAARSPAAFTTHVLTTRIKQSHMVDAAITPSSIETALRELASPRMGSLVDCDIDPVSKHTYWYATEAGIRRWTLDGRIPVEG